MLFRSGVTVHTIDCATLEKFSDEPERWLDISWNEDNASDQVHVSRVRLVLVNQPGALGTLSNVIAKNHGNINNLNIINRTAVFFGLE